MNIESTLPALITSLEDRDERVRELAGQAIGEIGPNAAAAVPPLIKLLSDLSEGSRNSACIGLAGIGPAADRKRLWSGRSNSCRCGCEPGPSSAR